MLEKVVAALNRNEIVCFPTETVYALACSAYREEALSQLCKIKGRSASKPLSLLCRDMEQVEKLVALNNTDREVLKILTPGPITFVLSMRPTQSLPRSFFRGTLGIRIPDHEIANAVLQAVRYPLAATSANISGVSGAARAIEVPAEVRENISEFWKDDTDVSGVCSTVFELNTKRVLRAGMLPERVIFDAIRAVQ